MQKSIRNDISAIISKILYNFEYAPMPLSAGGFGLFVDETHDYIVLEKASNSAFQALWIEISVPGKKKTSAASFITNAIS